MVFSLFKAKEDAFDPALVIAKRKAPRQVNAEFAGLCRTERVARAFADMPLDERESEAVGALLDAPGSTCVELSRSCGWMDTRWRTQMLLLCQRRRRYLLPEGMSDKVSNGMIISALAEYDTYASTFSPRRDVVKNLRHAVQAAH